MRACEKNGQGGGNAGELVGRLHLIQKLMVVAWPFKHSKIEKTKVFLQTTIAFYEILKNRPQGIFLADSS